ncbi:fatty acid desaturase [Neotabrizicola shimadae]|uniref:Fatty acid desaturase n=1 Tax=Neotabrizicola shimadae TaxID=2807096 RepID=A0A8G1EBV6_9RHOB|nr:fatty acid desaturase [Neotabrizicola shimadae]QYZ68531.1 fatty acid desaturase [Neotabrizicola shimadae]
MRDGPDRVEWPTILLLAATYAVWGLGTTVGYSLSPVLGMVLTGVAIAQFSSLQHEVLHGHPFRSAALNEALVFPALSLTVPYGRFRDTHLAHHHDPILTDPYDDPESNYLDPKVWGTLARWQQAVLRANNTLLGRVLIGPLVGNFLWLRSEAKLAARGEPGVRRDWLKHLAGFVPLVAWLWFAAMPWWAYLLAAWIGHALLKIRTYLEHRAHEAPRARTVIIEDRGPLALLFLNNNLHVVHHMHPAVPWYRLPAIYGANRAHYLRRNDHYHYRSYAEIFRRHLLRAKDPVPHPLMPRD